MSNGEFYEENAYFDAKWGHFTPYVCPEHPLRPFLCRVAFHIYEEERYQKRNILYLFCHMSIEIDMKMDIYEFKADVHKDGKWFIGVIDELHVQDQAKSLREFESELKDAVDTVVEFLLEKNNRKEMKSPILRSLITRS